METEPILKDVLLFALGSGVTLVVTLASAFLQRLTASSALLFERRLEALNAVWAALVQARSEFTPRVGMGHKNWMELKYKSALSALDRFQRAIEINQVLLDAQVVLALRAIDVYLYTLPDEEDLTASQFVSELRRLTQALESAVQKSMRRITHRVTLTETSRRKQRS